MRQLALVAKVNYLRSHSMFSDYTFDSIKSSKNVCEYERRPANWRQATTIELGLSLMKRISISIVTMSIIVLLLLMLAPCVYKTCGACPCFFLTFYMSDLLGAFIFFFDALFPPTLNGRYERSLSNTPAFLIIIPILFVVVLSGFAAILHFLCSQLIWYKSRVESNPRIALGWIIGIGLAMVTLPFLGPFVAFAFGLVVAEIAAQCITHSRRLLIPYYNSNNIDSAQQSNSIQEQLV